LPAISGDLWDGSVAWRALASLPLVPANPDFVCKIAAVSPRSHVGLVIWQEIVEPCDIAGDLLVQQTLMASNISRAHLCVAD
jgi:hypothetical protein